MYLSQGASALLFTVIRLALQASSIYLISHIASRSYNLTYLERINGGVLIKLRYIIFTKFPSKRKQYLGRFYVTLTLIITIGLNYLPTYLSNRYPVEPINFEDNQEQFDVSALFLKPTSLTPNHTRVEDILFAMGVSLNGATFSKYTTMPPLRENCQFIENNVECLTGTPDVTNTTFGGLGGMILAQGFTHGTTYVGEGSLSGTDPHQPPHSFRFYNFTSNDKNVYAVVDMYRVAAFDNGFGAERPNGPRSVEQCLFRTRQESRCVRHSLGFHFDKYNRDEDIRHWPFLISRRVAVQTVRQHFQDNQDLLNPPQFACQKLARSGVVSPLETMCRQITSLGIPPEGWMYTTQQERRSPNGGSAAAHWDVVTAYQHGIDIGKHWFLEAFTLDVTIGMYKTKMDTAELRGVLRNQSLPLMDVYDQEVFEATHFFSESEAAGAGPDATAGWSQWGFSTVDMNNLTNFLLSGTYLNNGSLILLKPSLLANVSNLMVSVSFGTSLAMVLIGLLISYSVPWTVHKPITEVLQDVLASRRMSNEDPFSTQKDRHSFFSRCQVANLFLEYQAPQQDMEVGEKDAHTSYLRPRSARRTLVLRMELESEDEADAVQLLETTKDYRNKGSRCSSLTL